MLNRPIPLSVINKGFWKLNLYGLPVSLLLLAYVGTMGSGGPGADPPAAFAVTAAFLYLLPAALVAAHIAGAKLFDTVLRRVPLGTPEISWFGVLFSAVLVVVAANVFVDDLYQFRQGNYGISVMVLFLDICGMAAIVLAGGGAITLAGD